jgi:hypothetical protein
MPGVTPGAVLRDLQQAQAGLKKARALLKEVRTNPRLVPKAFEVGWESLKKAYRVMAEIPEAATDDDVLTKQLAVARYSTALLVRLRRIKRNPVNAEGLDDRDDFDDDLGED